MKKTDKLLSHSFNPYNEDSYLCEFCCYLRSRNRKQCDAYLKSIPIEIWNGEIDHRQSYDGDNGIIFEPKNETAAYNAAQV